MSTTHHHRFRRSVAARVQAKRTETRRKLPPGLLPGVSRRANGGSGRLRILAIVFGLFLLGALGTVMFAVSAAAAGTAATLVAFRDMKESLPNGALITADVFQTTRILDRNGTLLQEISDPDNGWRTFVPIEKISPYLVDATVAAEDATFWSHTGIEPVSLIRLVMINLGTSGSSGGSTITQQLVRTLYPDQVGNAPTIDRKWREALAAVALEQQFSKHDIMTMYLNQIFYGNRSYGSEAAAQTFFHKHASELTLSEASLLAGIPQQPTNFNPSLYPDEAKERQDYVLDQMVKLGYVTRAEADAAWADFPRIFPARDGDGAPLNHPHFVQYVHEYLAEQFPDRDLMKGGLDIYTTIDTGLQERAETIVAENVKQLEFYNAHNAALTIIKPSTGEILSMVGSADFDNASIEGQVNIATSPQQPGSSIKPFIYAAAFEQGWNPSTVVLDAPFKIKTPGAIDPVTQKEMPFYEPQNYLRTFNGAVTVRTALANSLNIPAVKAASFIGGPRAAIDIMRRMGMKHALEQPPDDYGFSIALGAGDIWPLEETNGYATFANMGKYVPATPILKITDSQGRVMYELDQKNALAKAEQAIRPEIAYQIISILTDNNSRALVFTTNNLFGNTQTALKRPTAAKSGTTNDFRDIWTQGFTTDVAIGVWVGNTRNDPLAEIDGIQGAGPIWAALMTEMHSNPDFQKLLLDPNTGQPVPNDFPRPPDIIDGVVCAATGAQPIDEWNGNKTELLIRDGAPYTRCDQMTPWQQADLADTLKTMGEIGGNFTGGAAATINNYARAVRFQQTKPEVIFPQPDPPGGQLLGD